MWRFVITLYFLPKHTSFKVKNKNKQENYLIRKGVLGTGLFINLIRDPQTATKNLFKSTWCGLLNPIFKNDGGEEKIMWTGHSCTPISNWYSIHSISLGILCLNGVECTWRSNLYNGVQKFATQSKYPTCALKAAFHMGGDWRLGAKYIWDLQV